MLLILGAGAKARLSSMTLLSDLKVKYFFIEIFSVCRSLRVFLLKSV